MSGGLRWNPAQLEAWRERRAAGGRSTGCPAAEPVPVDDDGLCEADHARLLVQWARGAQLQYPELRLLFHIPNGEPRSAAVGRKLAAMGVKAGVSDYLLPVKRAGFSGLWLELKVARGRLTKAQRAWQIAMRAQGFIATTAVGWQAARRSIIQYLEATGDD